MIVAVAGYCHQHRGELDAWRLTVAVGMAAVPIGLVLLQNDLGTAAVLGVCVGAVLVVAGIKVRHALVLFLLGVSAIAAVVATGTLDDYKIDRIASFIDQEAGEPASQQSQAEYNLDQAKSAIVAGGFDGAGLFNGTLTKNAFVPEQHTDFIFTVVGEELGFVGGATVLALYGLLAWRLWRIAVLSPDFFGTLVVRRGPRDDRVPGVRERRDDARDHADHRAPAAVPVVRRLGGHRGLHGGRAGAQRPHAPVLLSRQGVPGRPAGPGPGRTGPRLGWGEMSDLWPRIEPLLARVEKPARYIGLELGAVRPDWAPGQAAFLLIYPDTYEIGLPNQGLQILYEILNERPDALAERAYAPWVDMEAAMRAAGVPLFGLETNRPATDFDVLAFNLSAELVYTNVLNCVDLAGVPVRSEDRGPHHPLVIAGGHCAYNPEPLAEYVDAFVIGDGEEAIGEIAEVVGAWKRAGRASREAVLRDLASVPGVYVPSLYEVVYEGPAIREVRPRHPDVPAVVDKRTIADLAEWPYPSASSSRSSRWSTTGSTWSSSGAAPAAAGSARRA
ncbi:MAG: hypothetical protein KatS3mg009_2970 [Acidimicrobiia bacterium]|nr:MAG: hypothetical protein KatS3mg009_2970 [Acidimicrobiia bacterium]